MAKRARRTSKAESPPEVTGPPKWLLLSYEPVSLFSLRTTYSMSKGGKTLLLPTPYAIKMALIDAVFRMVSAPDAEVAARAMFDRIKQRQIRFRPPAECVVQNTFVKIRQDERGTAAGLYVPTIAYRELVYYSGQLQIAIDASGWDESSTDPVRNAAMHVNYFGKRGSFFQFVGAEIADTLPAGVTIPNGESIIEMPIGQYGVTQFLDDFGPDLVTDRYGFERISTYHDKDIRHEKHRKLVATLVPYRRIEATRSFTRYTSIPSQNGS